MNVDLNFCSCNRRCGGGEGKGESKRGGEEVKKETQYNQDRGIIEVGSWVSQAITGNSSAYTEPIR